MKLTSTSEPASIWAMSKVMPRMVLKAPRDEQQQGGEQAEHQRRAEEGRHSKHAHFGDGRLKHGQQQATDRELRHIDRKTDRDSAGARIGSGNAPWREQAADHRDIEQKLELGCQID